MTTDKLFLATELTTGIAAIVGVVVWRRFAAVRNAHRARVSQGSQVMLSPFGQIEFATAGRGQAVLVIHGAGGGFDQVISVTDRLTAAGYQVIAPSRFGYLRSSSPRDQRTSVDCRARDQSTDAGCFAGGRLLPDARACPIHRGNHSRRATVDIPLGRPRVGRSRCGTVRGCGHVSQTA